MHKIMMNNSSQLKNLWIIYIGVLIFMTIGVAQFSKSDTTPDNIPIVIISSHLKKPQNQVISNAKYDKVGLLNTTGCVADYQYCVQNNIGYNVSFRVSPSDSPIAHITKSGSFVEFSPLVLRYRGVQSWDEQQELASISAEDPNGFVYNGSFVYNNIFMPGIMIQLDTEPKILKEYMVINDSSVLPEPSSWLCSEPNCTIFFEFESMFTHSTDTNVYVNGMLFDEGVDNVIVSYDIIEFRALDTNRPVFGFEQPYAVDAVGARIDLDYSVSTNKKKTYVYWQLPYGWLNDTSRVYPVIIDPEVIIHDLVDSTSTNAMQGQGFFVNDTHGFVFYVDTDSNDITYAVTADAGVTWDGGTAIWADATEEGFAVWWDRWSYNFNTDTAYAMNLDTSPDKTFLTIFNYTTRAEQQTSPWDNDATLSDTDMKPSIVRANKKLYALVPDTLNSDFIYSLDDGSTWTEDTPAFILDIEDDYGQLMPLPNDDIMIVYADVSDTRVYYSIWDNESMGWNINDTFLLDYNGASDSSYPQGAVSMCKLTGDVYVAWTVEWNANSGTTVYKYDYSESQWVGLTNITTGAGNETLASSIFVNQNNCELYVVYAAGPTGGALTSAVYRYSSDDGNSWGPEISISTTIDDIRYVSTNMMSNETAYAFWYNDDLGYLLGAQMQNITPSAPTPPAPYTENPVIDNTVNVAPDTAYITNNLTCNVTVTDDNTSLTAQWYWFNGTAEFSHGNTSVSNNTNTLLTTLGAGNLTVGDVWNCTVIANDSLNWSAYDSDTVTILAGDTCTPPAINNNWAITISDNCSLSNTETDLGLGNISLNGDNGWFKIENVNITFTNLYMTCTNCKYIQVPPFKEVQE